jgi:hypothetical protein
MATHLPGQAEQFINIALAISDVHAAIRIVEQRGGLADVLQPADAFLFLDRYARRINAALKLIGAVKLVTIPELDCGQTEWQPSGSSYKAGMHQDAARGAIFAGIANGQLLQHSYRSKVLTCEGEVGRVVENQNWKHAGGRKPVPCGSKVPGQNIRFRNSLVAEEPICRFRVRPVLTGPGVVAPTFPASCSSNCRIRLPWRTSWNSQPITSLLIHSSARDSEDSRHPLAPTRRAFLMPDTWPGSEPKA